VRFAAQRGAYEADLPKSPSFYSGLKPALWLNSHTPLKTGSVSERNDEYE
jgi:hypothetical protein